MRKIFLHTVLCAVVAWAHLGVCFSYAQAQSAQERSDLEDLQLERSYEGEPKHVSEADIKAVEDVLTDIVDDVVAQRRATSKFIRAGFFFTIAAAVGAVGVTTVDHLATQLLSLALFMGSTAVGFSSFALAANPMEQPYRDEQRYFDLKKRLQEKAGPPLRNMMLALQRTLLDDYREFKQDYKKIMLDGSLSDERRSHYQRIARRSYFRGYTLAHLAALRNDAEMIEALSQLAGAASVHRTDAQGRRPMDLAMDSAASEALSRLVQTLFNSSRSGKIKYAKDIQSVFSQLEERATDAEAALVAFETQHPFLLRSEGTKLHTFWWKKYTQTLVLDEQKNEKSWQFYRKAVRDILDASIPRNEHLNETTLAMVDRNGNTLLHFAAALGNMKAAAALIRAGGPVLAKNKGGLTFLDVLRYRVASLDVMARDMSEERVPKLIKQHTVRRARVLEKTANIVQRIVTARDKASVACRDLLQST